MGIPEKPFGREGNPCNLRNLRIVSPVCPKPSRCLRLRLPTDDPQISQIFADNDVHEDPREAIGVGKGIPVICVICGLSRRFVEDRRGASASVSGLLIRRFRRFTQIATCMRIDPGEAIWARKGIRVICVICGLSRRFVEDRRGASASASRLMIRRFRRCTQITT
jgi:hypothetical protein